MAHEYLKAARQPGSAPVLPVDLLRRFDVTGPRYTSYPTADRFVEAFDNRAVESWLRARSIGQGALPWSIYVHIPFCASLCHYCACNKIITKDREKGTAYVRDLAREIELYQNILGKGQTVSSLHFGGGTPTFLADEELDELMHCLDSAFTILPTAEQSIEVDPRTVDRARLKRLAAMGFNRVSFGVQDFNPDVQEAVHRIQSTERVFEVVSAARDLDFRSINVDLIYGLPRQTVATFDETLRTLRQLRPDRIALYAYAHLPARFKPQRRISEAELPTGEAKLVMLQHAIDALNEEGYVYIGMDHFALPEDSLAIAQRQGHLQRNFQGYSSQADGDLLGFGVSAIGRIGPTYCQNAKTLDEYRDQLAQHRLPVVKGIELSSDDLLRRAIIMAIMCQGRVDIEAFEVAYLIEFPKAFAKELAVLREYEDLGLIRCGAQYLDVTELGRYFVRAIAMVFDRYLVAQIDRTRFSRIL